MAVETRQISLEELDRLPDPGYPFEIVNGEVVPVSPVQDVAAIVAGRVLTYLGHHVLANQLGECLGSDPGFVVSRSPLRLRVPDLAFVGRDRTRGGAREAYFEGAPDLVGEVVSPSDPFEAVVAKVKEWLAAGARLVWVFVPRTREVYVYTPDQPVRVLGEADLLDGGEVVPGFRAPVADCFPPLARAEAAPEARGNADRA